MSFTLGVEFTTFSIVARCPRTGMLGVGITTREMAVGSRCPHVRAGVGAVATQASTDPRLGPLALRLLELGFSAPKVLRELEGSDPYIEPRQLAVVDRDGTVAARTGTRNRQWAGHVLGEGSVALGNALLGPHVAEAMARAFRESEGEDLEERLLRAVEAGRDAGGQHGGQQSAALLVCDRDAFPRVDLRVDQHPEPVGELRRLLDLYRPLIPYYARRPRDPDLPRADEWLRQQGR